MIQESTMKILNLNLTLLAIIFGLSACGGGGGGNNDSNDNNQLPANNLPEISGTPGLFVKANTTYSFIPQAEDSDGDELTFSIDNQPPWAEFNPQTGELSGIPENDQAGFYSAIIINVSDGRDTVSLEAFDLQVLLANLTRENIVVQGTETPVVPANEAAASAFKASGTTTISLGDNEQQMENADLQFEFDEEGNLIDLFGEADLPPKLSDNLAIDSKVKARVGLLKGHEINADADFGIQLKDEFDYIAFYVGTSTDITIGDSEGGVGESLTLSPPLSGEIVFIFDPTDVFYYYFASIPLVGEAGTGRSVRGFIPFIPQEDYDQLDSFEGHFIDKASFGIGFKVFDFFELEGTRVIKLPVPKTIDWENPLQSDIDFKAGLNGNASFSFSIFSVGLFEFDIASTSGTFDVGVDRQHFAMQTTIAPDVSWQPEWFPILPSSEIVGQWSINGSGEFSVGLQGSYDSVIPQAKLQGSMTLNNDGAKFTAAIPSGNFPIAISAEFVENETRVAISADIDPAATITQAVNNSLDQQLDQLQESIDNLTNAIADYEFEVSLRGLRSAIPEIVDTSVGILNAIPGAVRDSVDAGVVNALRDACRTYTIIPATPITPAVRETTCAADHVNENSIGDSIGATARNQASNRVNTIIPQLSNLKTLAQQADDESLRDALKQALEEVYAQRTFSLSLDLSYTVSFPIIGNQTFTVYKNTWTRQVIPTDTANQIKTAAENVYRIQETSNIQFSMQNIVDALPTEEAINTAKQEVQNGLAQIPSFNGAGYTVNGDSIEGYILLDNERKAIDLNFLNPEELLKGIGDYISSTIIE